MTVHELKCWPQQFQGIWLQSKSFEFRRDDDRRFDVGHALHLREWDPKGPAYTGRDCVRSVVWIERGPDFGIPAGYVVMGLR